MRPYRVQVVGGIVLHQGRIAEMKTGEGKTLVATLPAYLNALAGKGVHIVTVNDYLAKRDSEWMGKVYRFMGLTVGLVIHGVMGQAKKDAYAADITYGTNNEFGFDYLRDNMAIYKQELVQRGHAFAIVDEVDSILIDEARTPLIISGQGDKSTQLYTVVDQFVSRLKCQRIAKVDAKEEEDPDIDADYIVDEKARTATLTARGIAKAEQAFQVENLADMENTTLSHHINQAIKAHGVMKRDIDYVVKDGQVIIVDEFTGRLMFGRRYNEGLHQAIEAKEHVEVANESKTLATITFQNYFRLYDKLSGMTGTAMTEEEEFGTIYELDIVEIPTNKPLARIDHPDVVYKNEPGKLRAVVNQIEECHQKGQPVLVGTVSIEKSEELSELLTKRGIKHNVLNAKNHEKEAEIVAQAGKFGAVTVATNMAGRGTDIMLGGNAEFLARADLRKAGMSDELIAEATGYAETDNQEILDARRQYAQAEAKYKEAIKAEAEKVRAVGGLFILGTERHESRRIDNQLRGRAGRQGDPGETRFFLSLEDDIMRLFGSERVMGMMEKLGVDEDTPIDAKMLSGAIENAQKQVESRNFQTRKNVLQYDDVMNTQREVIYKQRRQVLDGEDLQASIQNMLRTMVENAIHGHMGEQKHMDRRALPGGGVPLPHHVPGPRRADAHRRGAAAVRRRGPGGPGDGEGRGRLSGQGAGVRLPPHAGAGAGHHAPGGGRVLDGPDRRHERPEAGHRPAGLRPDRPGGGLQEGRLRDVRGHDRRHPGGDPAPAVPGPPAPERGGQAGAGGQGHRRVRRRRRHRQEAARHEGHQDRPQRPLPLRQRPEVEEMHL